MKNLKLILLLFLFTGIVSCKKNKYETTSVKVTLIDKNTQQGIPNRKITLYEVID